MELQNIILPAEYLSADAGEELRYTARALAEFFFG